MGAGELQARTAATAEERGHQRAVGQQTTALEGPHIKVRGGGRRICFINYSIQEANCNNHLTISDEKLPTETSQCCTRLF